MASKKAPLSDGDWICADSSCGNVNFTWRTNCNKCGKEKGKVDIFKKTGHEVGKALATKSGGLFSADDWQCAKCGNINWARRSECNICNEPKFGKVEARTGAGGGYNERENVEYIEREESDDEFDEFGRKKKKKFCKLTDGEHAVPLGGETGNGNYSIQSLPEEGSGLNDEDSEDDSDEDTAKYDLFADLDKEPQDILRRSRSRSCSNDRSQMKLQDRRDQARKSKDYRSESDEKTWKSRSRSRDRRERRSRSRSRDRRDRSSRSRDRRDRRSRSRSRDRRDRRSRSRDRRDRRSRSRSRDRRDRRSKSRDRRDRRSRSRSRSRDRRDRR